MILSLRDPARPRLRPILLAVLCAASASAVLRADEPPKPPAGEVRLETGRAVDYTIHFDRNSLQDSIRLGDDLIGLTSSGALLRFELPAVRLVRERIDTEEVTCLGRGEGAAVLAGLRDGRVCRVDPTTLLLTDVTKLSAAPRWIGWGQAAGGRPAGLVVVTRLTRPMERDGEHWDAPYSVVHDLATGKTFSLEDEATTFLLDGSGQVWLGADRGEWGGRITRVDLASGTVEALKPPPSRQPGVKAFWAGVYGFVALRDGRILAFGGSSHMGFSAGYLTRIDGAEPRPLFASPPRPEPGKEPDTTRPMLPITHVVEESGGLLVFSYSDVFRVDKELKSWKKIATLEIQYRWGRPDAVGSYPSVRAVHPPIRDGEPYVLATVADGYVGLEGAKVTSHSLPGQLGASDVYRVENTAEGTLYSEGDDTLPTWVLGAKGWEVASLAPPFEIEPASEDAAFEKEEETWHETRVLVDPRGSIYTVSGTGVSAGTRTTARRVGGKSARLGREVSTLEPSFSFITGDGTLWNATSDELKRFANGRWETVAPFPHAEYLSELVPLNTNGPPWPMLDRYRDNLWRLDTGAPKDKPRLTRIAVGEGGKTLRVDDAIPWPDDSLLLATDAGLRAYSPKTGKLSRVDLPEPASPPTTLVRDGLGRLWTGCGSRWTARTSSRGLWLHEPGARAAEPLDRVPWVARSKVDAIVPDPRHADGVIVALGPRGVAFVRARRMQETK